ncbi:MAG: hypothetical protein MUE47_07150 [Acidobacteria bacterium]|nr:hypothetical protein [Acidobacteriota bacterium]
MPGPAASASAPPSRVESPEPIVLPAANSPLAVATCRGGNRSAIIE